VCERRDCLSLVPENLGLNIPGKSSAQESQSFA